MFVISKKPIEKLGSGMRKPIETPAFEFDNNMNQKTT